MTRKRPDLDRRVQFELDCPGCPDPDAEGKRRFREGLISLMTLLAEWIAESEADCITPDKEMKAGAGFPFTIELDMDKSWWSYLLTVKARKKTQQQESEYAR